MKIIDATNSVLGRLASIVAKLALQGETIRIVNCEKAIISGERRHLIKFYTERIHRGNALKGPYFPKNPEAIVRRTIRGMLPYKTERGKKALKRIKTYVGVPEEFKNKAEKIPEVLGENKKIIKYITLEDLSKRLGGRQ